MSGPKRSRIGKRPAALGVIGAASAVVIGIGAGAGLAGPEPAPGTSQSPIDLREDRTRFVEELPALRVGYPLRADVTLVNTGSPDEEATIRADVPAGSAYVTLRGVRYDLLQFHWHTPSEHELEGRRAPLEMHFVHRAADGSLLVVGALMTEGRAPNLRLAPVFRSLPATSGATAAVPGVPLAGLLPRDRSSYRYEGSLTTPPFTEGVRWIVLERPIRVSERQIEAFQEIFEEGNSREVQPLNGRTVLSDAEDGDDD